MPPIDLLNPLNAPVAGPPMLPAMECPVPREMLPSDDGVPMESNWHRHQMNLLIDVIEWHRRDRRDFFAGGNMFIHYSEEQVRNRDFLGPDVFLVNDVDGDRIRDYWAIWDEGGRLPDFIVELMSPTTKHLDLDKKYGIYEQIFKTKEYVAYDPSDRKVNAWRLAGGRYQPIAPDADGRYFLETVGLSLGFWNGKYRNHPGTYLRLFDGQGRLVPTEAEAVHARASEAKAEASEAKAEASEAKARADAAEAREVALAAEVARLKAQLEKPA